MLGSFAFHWRSTGPKERPVARIVLAGVDDDGADDELARAIALGGAGWRSRTLATVPANLKTPAWLAEQAVEVGEARRPRGAGLGRRSGSRPRASAASAPSAAARSTSPG